MPRFIVGLLSFSFLLHFLIIVLLFNNQKLTIKQSPCPNHPISASLQLLSHAAMLKTLRSLGQSIEANDMCDEVFKEHNPLTEFRQTLQVQSHLEMPRIHVQLGHIQRT